MTVKELRDWCNSYMSHGDGDGMLNDVELDKLAYEERCNREVMVIDDGMWPKYFKIESAIGTNFDRMVKPAKTEKRKVVDKSCAYCKKCKNMVEGSAKGASASGGFYIGKRFVTIDCNNPRCGSIIKDVIEYIGSPCMDYDPKEPTYVETNVQVEPPEYKTERIAALVVNMID